MRTSEKTGDLLVKVGLAAGAYFLVVVPVLQALGLKEDAADRIVNDAEAGNLPGGNPWLPNYWKAARCSSVIDAMTAKSYAQKIYDAFGFFGDDEAAVIAVFRGLRTKCDVSRIADEFAMEYDADLFGYIKSGSTGSGFWGGLSTEDLVKVVQIVNGLK